MTTPPGASVFPPSASLISMMRVLLAIMVLEALVLHGIHWLVGGTIWLVITLLSDLALLNFIMLMHALPRRPSTIMGDQVRLRFGNWLDVTLPADKLELVGGMDALAGLKVLDAALLASPTVYLKFREERDVRGFGGIAVKRGGARLAIEDAERFRTELALLQAAMT